MKLLRPSALFTVIFVLGAAPAAFAQSFAVAATPVNTASAGTGSIKYTVTGIPADGTVIVGCQYSGSSTYQEQNKLPVCNGGPVVAFPVTTGQTLTGTIGLIPWGAPMPLALHRAPHNLPRVFVSGFLFAGAPVPRLRASPLSRRLALAHPYRSKHLADRNRPLCLRRQFKRPDSRRLSLHHYR